MFRLEVIVEDKRLPAVLHALTGLVIGQPTVQPVVNAEKTGNGLAAVSNGSEATRFVDRLKKHKGKQLSGGTAREIMRELGLNPTSASYFLRTAINAGVLRKSGKGKQLTYKVL